MRTAEVAERLAERVGGGELQPGARVPSVRAVAAELGCAPATAAAALRELAARGVIEGRDRARAVVARDGAGRARALLGGGGPPLRLAGSDDPGLDALLRAAGEAVAVASGARGSVAGLGLLACGAADAAALHLRHEPSRRHNDPFVRHLLGDERVVLVRLWVREQGLVVPRGNPEGIRGPADLAGRRLAWRAPGTGSRLLLERELRAAGVEPQPDRGEPGGSHLGVAVAVATGAADAGLAVRAAARAADLDFVPLAEEPFELALREAALPAAAAPLLERLSSPEVRASVAALGGYDLADAGAIRRAA